MKRLYFWLALLGFLVVHALMLSRVEPVATYFFVFVWWSYILMVDGFIFWRRGASLFSRLRPKILILVFFSYLFWEFFELINSQIANWGYISLSAAGEIVFNNPVVRIVFKVLAFGSVLPGILETHELLEFIGLGKRLKFLGWERTARFFRWKWWGRPRYLWMVAGIILFFVSLLWPRYFFWTIWIAAILILDPMVESDGGKSIFSELREGRIRTFYRLLLTGLVCGVLWETWNYWAGLKWTYDVPFVGGWKIFEMPALGYPGFTLFAVESYIFYQWLRCQNFRLNKFMQMNGGGSE